MTTPITRFLLGSLCAAGLLLGNLAPAVWAEHTPELRWMMRHTSADGIGCCAEPDCREAKVALVRFFTLDETGVVTEETPNAAPPPPVQDNPYAADYGWVPPDRPPSRERALVLINDEMYDIPRASVHPSEDGKTYVCLKVPNRPIDATNIRCAFYTIGW